MNAVKNGINSQVSERINPTAPKPTKKPRKQATATTAAAPVVEGLSTVDKPLTTEQRAELLQALPARDQRLVADVVAALGGESVPPSEPEPVAREAADYRPEEAFQQLLLPLALAIFKNVLDPEDVFSGKYQLNNFLDYMLDELPDALDRCDNVALIKFIDRQIN